MAITGVMSMGVHDQPTAGGQLADPSSVIIGRVSAGCSPAILNIQWTSNSGGDEDDFSVQFRENGGAWTDADDSPDDASPASHTLNVSVNDDFEARVKANGSGIWTDSNWVEDTSTYTVDTCK
jgi:hypothetical protein